MSAIGRHILQKDLGKFLSRWDHALYMHSSTTKSLVNIKLLSQVTRCILLVGSVQARQFVSTTPCPRIIIIIIIADAQR